jgi:ketosteroid isomerase-like protein
MTAKELALKSYELFKIGDMEGLKALCHDNYTMTLNGMHVLSGTYHGADSFIQDLLANIPVALPNFSLEIVDSFGSADGAKVFTILNAKADGLKAVFGHYMRSEDGKIVEFIAFDDSQKMAHAMNAVVLT